MTLSAARFLRRFLVHVLPGGFVRIRHFGFLAYRGRTAKLARCRALLAVPPPVCPPAPETMAALAHQFTGVDFIRCPGFGVGRLHRSTRLTAGLVAIFRPGHSPAPPLDSS